MIVQLSFKSIHIIKVVLDCTIIYIYIYCLYTLLIINPLNVELNPICHLLALLGGATIVVVSRLRVKNNVDALPENRSKGSFRGGKFSGPEHPPPPDRFHLVPRF